MNERGNSPCHIFGGIIPDFKFEIDYCYRYYWNLEYISIVNPVKSGVYSNKGRDNYVGWLSMTSFRNQIVCIESDCSSSLLGKIGVEKLYYV